LNTGAREKTLPLVKFCELTTAADKKKKNGQHSFVRGRPNIPVFFLSAVLMILDLFSAAQKS